MWREIEFEALSAGIKPKGLNSLAIEAMNEIGIDISDQQSKDVVSFLGQYIPYIVTVCDNARERCLSSTKLQVPALELRRSCSRSGFARRKTGCLPAGSR